MSEADLLFLEPPVLAEVTQVNQVKVETVTVQAFPPIVTEFPCHPSTLPGNPVPVTLIVVPPPRLPSEGWLLMIRTEKCHHFQNIHYLQ